MRTIERPQFHTKESNSETSNNDINNNEIYFPRVTSTSKINHSTTLKNRIESTDVTFEEVLLIYVKSGFKEVFNVTCNRNEKNVSFCDF